MLANFAPKLTPLSGCADGTTNQSFDSLNLNEYE